MYKRQEEGLEEVLLTGSFSIQEGGVFNVFLSTKEYVEEFATPYKAAERGYVDAVIDPRNTRPTIINALKMLSRIHILSDAL